MYLSPAQLRALKAAPFDAMADIDLKTLRSLTRRGLLERVDRTVETTAGPRQTVLWERTPAGDRELERRRD